jgi:hypothetical protein
MSSLTLEAGSWVAGFGTSDLNSLANGSTAHSSLTAPQIDTTSTKEPYFQAEFVGGSISPTGAADVVVYFIPRNSADSAYSDGEASATAANQPIWAQYPHVVIALRTKATSAQSAMSALSGIIPPGKYQVGVLNRAGVALASSGNQVNIRLVTEAMN